MSGVYSIAIQLHKPLAYAHNTISVFLESGWRLALNPDDGFLYLPLGDNHRYTWEGAATDKWEVVLAEMEAKLRNGEEIGIVLHIEETSAQVIVSADLMTIRFNIYNSGRKRVGASQITDFSWYLKKIYQVIPDQYIVHVECNDWR